MYVITYAWKNMIRNKGRNSLLIIIIVSIITLSGISLIIYQGTSQIVEKYKEQYGSKVTLLSSLQAERIPTETLLSFSESNYLHSYEYTAKVPVLSSLKAVGEMENESQDSPKAWLIGSSSKEINESFRNGTKIMLKGTKNVGENQVLISKKLAELNHLDLESVIKLYGKGDQRNQIYTVKGIYDDLALQGSQDGIALMNPANELYTNYEELHKSVLFKEHGEMNGVFYLKSPDDLPHFQAELKKKGLPEGYEASTDRKGYEDMVQPIESLNHIASTATIGILILGSVLVLFLTMFSIRERKYEIGVLRSIGMKKHTVAKTLMYETLSIGLIAFVIGIVIAQFGGYMIGSYLLKRQMEIAQQIQMQNNLSNISFELDALMITSLCAVTILLALCSSFSGLVTIMRFEPRKILSERN